MKILRKTAMITCFLIYALGTFFNAQSEETVSDVYVIKLHGEVNDAMVSYLQRELDAALQNNQKVIVDIDTLGGLVSSAEEIVNILLTSPVETTAYVSGRAISAGVLLTIACDNVAMSSSSYIGAAEPVNSITRESETSEKTLSYVKGIMSTAAIENGRPEKVIHAMTDKRIVIEGYSEEGELLTLSSHQAIDLGVSDISCNSIDEVIDYFDLGVSYETAPYKLSDRVASGITSTIALNIFFTLGFAFMILEIFTAGFGAAGVIAIICFAMYFFGGFIAGTAEWWAAGLFILGAMALVIEFFIPGFGVFGISGLILFFLSLVFSSNSIEQFANRAGIAIIVCALLVIVLLILNKFEKIKIFDKIANKEMQTVGEGYVINQISEETIGKVAVAVTDLRPIGVVVLEDKRMDAFSEEGFIAKNSQVLITGKKSSSVVVRKAK